MPATELTLMIEPPFPRRKHVRYSYFHGAPDSGQVGVDQCFPLIVGHLPEPSPIANACISHHDIQPLAEFSDPRSQHRAQCVPVTYVSDPRDDARTFGFNQPLSFLQIGLCRGRIRLRGGGGTAMSIAMIERALAGKAQGVASTLASRGTGNECDPPGQQQRHRPWPFMLFNHSSWRSK